jgi:hypothetical protein
MLTQRLVIRLGAEAFWGRKGQTRPDKVLCLTTPLHRA